MPLVTHRSNRTEELARLLFAHLVEQQRGPGDPFAEVPVVVGSHGMQRWIEHRVATARGVATRLAFPFPWPAIEGAVRALLDDRTGASADRPSPPFWRRRSGPDPWSVDSLRWRLLPILRDRLGDPAAGTSFGAVRRYLRDPGSGPFDARATAFAGELAAVLDALLRRRPRFVGDPGDAWLGRLLDDLADRIPEPHPAVLLARLERAFESRRPPDLEGRLHVFGLSTLLRHELAALALIGRAASLRVDLYLLVPSRA